MVDISSIRANSVTVQNISGKTGLTSPVAQTETLSMDLKEGSLMKNRRDVKPKELTSLFGTLVKAFDGNPVEAKKAYTQAGRLLVNRSDIRPEAVGKMVVGMNEQLEAIRPEGPL